VQIADTYFSHARSDQTFSCIVTDTHKTYKWPLLKQTFHHSH